jgi:uncharacterized protein YjdB
MKTIFRIAIWWAPLLLLFVSCEREIYSLNVTPETLSITSVHDHPVLTATVVDVDGEEIPVNDVEWSSSDTRVVEINENGRVTARGNGQAVITARTKADAQYVEVTVNLGSRH